jgi:hypothetical protein
MGRTCMSCGALNGACCPGDVCQPGGECTGAMMGMGGTCAPCGGAGQACCNGGGGFGRCNDGFACAFGAADAGATCEPCGASGQACCGGGPTAQRMCGTGLTCTGPDGGRGAPTCR